MKPSNVDELIREKEELWDLLEDLTGRIREIREEMLTELDDLEDMILETSGMRLRLSGKKVHV